MKRKLAKNQRHFRYSCKKTGVGMKNGKKLTKKSRTVQVSIKTPGVGVRHGWYIDFCLTFGQFEHLGTWPS